jgi:glycosyltransferase involved in cell wall biosynthesis
MAKFARYLPDFGWQPYVWSLDRMAEFPIDESLRDELPSEVIVMRQKADWCVRAGNGLRAWGRSNRVGHAACSRLEWRLRQRLLADRHPDVLVRWARQSVRPLLRLINTAGIDAIFSSFSPASNHFLGMTLARKTGLPWIADFRDLWTDDYRYGEPPDARRQRDRALELSFLERADLVIGVTDKQTAMLANRLPDQRGKFLTITNGFDRADFRRNGGSMAGSGVRPMRFVLGYVGRLEARRVPDALVEGFRQFGNWLGDRRSTFLFRVSGHAGDETRARLTGSGLPCAFEDYLPHKQAIERMHAADALLVVVPDARNSDTTVPGKPYEYMATGRPLLHIGPENGACAELIRSCDAGRNAVIASSSICTVLIELYQQWSSGVPLAGCRPSVLARFERTKLTGRLAGLLDEVRGSGIGVTSGRREGLKVKS